MSSRPFVLAALSIALFPCALAACGASSAECSSDDGFVNVDDSGTHGELGTPGPYFAGTACHCETTTQAQETMIYTQEGVNLTSSRSSDGTTCTVQPVGMDLPVFAMHSSGVAELSGGRPFFAAGIAFSTTGTWRCDRGSFRLDFATHTQSGDLTRQFLVAAPQCQLFPCASGLRCSVNASNPAWTACIADGSLSKDVSCNEDASCQNGLTCQSSSTALNVCR